MRAAAALVAALALAPAAGAAERRVEMPGLFVDPSRVVALVGDTVVWTNRDFRTHTVTADDGSFDSDDIAPGASFSLAFPGQGTFAYHCAIHRFIRGTVAVYGLALEGPERGVPHGGLAVFTGLAPVGTASVVLEAADGSAFTPAASAPVAADGSFRAVVRPERPGIYRASAGALTSAPVTLRVGARLELAVRRSGSAVLLRVAATPSQAGARLVLERYSRERFAWLPYRHSRFGPGSRAVFRLEPRRELRLRAVIVHGVRGWGPAASRAVVIRSA